MDYQEKLYSEEETAERLRIKARIGLWRLRKHGAIGFYQIGDRIFYGESHIKQFLARCERKAEGQKAAVAA